MLEFRFVTDEDISLSFLVRSKYSLRCFATDLAILLGCRSVSFDNIYNKKSTNFYTWFLEKNEKKDCFPEHVVYNDGKRNYCSINEYEIGIRPKISFSSIKDFCSESIYGDYRMFEVEFGEYPQSVVGYDTSNTLDMLFKNGKLRKTGKTYTIRKNEYVEYEHLGKKYIRIYEKRFLHDSLYSNGERASGGESQWIRVEPIKWLVDYNWDIAISKYILLSGMEYDDIYEFMDKHFTLDIINDKMRHNAGKFDDIDELDEFNERIGTLINQIEMYLVNIQDKDVIKNKVNMLLEEYETKLEDINSNQGISLYDIDFIKTELISKLELIIAKLKVFKDNNQLYYDILNVIDSILKYREIDDSCNNSLIEDFGNIFNVCLTFLKEEDRDDISKRIIKIINFEREKLLNYIKYIESFEDTTLLEEKEKIDYSSYEEFETKIRKLLHPILIEINDKVSLRNIELEVREALKDIQKNLYIESENKIISVYLNEINKLTINIRGLLKKMGTNIIEYEYTLRLNKILYAYISYDKDFLEILKNVSNIFVSLYKLMLEIEDNIENKNRINKSKVKIRIK